MIIFCSHQSFAQNKGFRFGIKGGVNLAQLETGDFFANRQYNGSVLVDNLKNSFDTQTGYVAGIYFRIGSSFYVQPEVQVSAKGGKLNIINAFTQENKVLEIDYTNLEVPLMLGYKYKFLRVMAGPVASFNVSSNEELESILNDYSTQPVQNTFKDASYGYQFGVGIDIMGLSLDVRREGSFSDISNAQIKSDLNNNINFSQKSRLWQVTLGLKIF
ncbi:MAG: PorT family protein [Pseudarcicella sp.]|nr:PorT family protein [Pseudarcicella sp.]